MAGYEYVFDDTRVGDARYRLEEYSVLQGALSLLEAVLRSWNTIAMTNGALEPPYAREVDDLQRMIEWGETELSDKDAREIVVRGISVGSLRYMKAALIHAAWFKGKGSK